MSEKYTCSLCSGTGKLLSEACSQCYGKGNTGNAMDYLAQIERRDRELNRDYENRHVPAQDWDRF